MALIVSQTLSFFETANQMIIPHATTLQISDEVIVTVGDLSDFDKDTISQIAGNLFRLGGRVANPAVNTLAATTIPLPPLYLGRSPNIVFALSMTLCVSTKRLGVS